MSDDDAVIVRAQGVGKKYCRSLRQSLFYLARDLAIAAVGGDAHRGTLRDGEFFALRDVSFELRRGQCLGVIGRNGAGKSTLLKLLSGIQRPDHGTISVSGRVGALIELGAGFHPLLTGRENISLLASIYGLSARETADRFDWIVDFSGVGEFLDMPVRSYSSGMVARLAFSIAASVEPEVLLVDEVLSVGDLTFQSRCLQRVGDLMRSGTCVIFISHQMSLVDKISDRILLLNPGDPPLLGEPAEIIEAYHRALSQQDVPGARLNHPSLTIDDVRIVAEGNRAIEPGSPLTIEADYRCRDAMQGYISFAIHRGKGEQLAACRSDRDGYGLVSFRPGNGRFRMHVETLPLAPGFYSVSVRVYGRSGFEVLVNHQASYGFVVTGGADAEALVSLEHRWEVEHGA